MSVRAAIYVRVSTEDQRDNGYSIDSQLRMIKEYCEKNEYDIVDVYNDAGHSGKDLLRPEMQRLLKDIKAKRIDKLIAIKVDWLTRNNYDGFWLLNYCSEYDVKIELILEPYDVLFMKKMIYDEYSKEYLSGIISNSKKHFLVDGVICAPYMEDNAIKDLLLLVPKKEITT